jgi:hypothetical protein
MWKFLVPPCASRNKTLPFLVGRLHKDPQAHARVRDQDGASDGSHFGDIRPERRVEMRRMQDVTHKPIAPRMVNSPSAAARSG